jgi:hypothetical protein
MNFPKLFRTVADIIETIEQAKPNTPRELQEILVCLHCQHVLRVHGEMCNNTVFVPRQVIDPHKMKPYFTPWKYRCGNCDQWGFEFEIDEIRPITNSTN